MRALVFVITLLLAGAWTVRAQAATYAALDDRELEVGGVLLVFAGDDAGGGFARESLLGVSIGSLTDEIAWQAWLAHSWNEESALLGGQADLILAHNFESFDCENCSGEDFGLWWIGAGATLIAYQEMFESDQGVAVDGEELGVNLGGSYSWEQFTASLYVHYFPDSTATLISAGLAKQL